MKFIFKMEIVLLTLISVLCSIVIFKLLYKLRATMPWRVNCWFCNCNFWIKFNQRNSWNCPKCEQYNGFTKDGDYNKPIFTHNEQARNPIKVFHSSPPKNGLCKMCNINQQLKVAQLANFVPMHETNFDEEIEVYKTQLEKAYKLCSPCKKVLQMKLHKEKETLLSSKLIEARTADTKQNKQNSVNVKLRSFVNTTSMFVAAILIVLVSIDCYRHVKKSNFISNRILNLKEILIALLQRVINIIKMKTYLTFPELENHFKDIDTFLYLDLMQTKFQNIFKTFEETSLLTQKVLGGIVCGIQIMGHLWNVNKLKYTIVIDLLWSIFVIMSIANHSKLVNPAIISLVKLFSTLTVFLVYKNIKTKAVSKPAMKSPSTPKKMKHLTNKTVTSMMDTDDSMSMETDDDVSLSKFGLHNFSESSNEAPTVLNHSLINGRSFTPRSNDSLWTKPKLNSTFCVNSVHKTPSSVSETVFVKPSFNKNSFNKYQNLASNDSDSELDESISSLCISSPKKTSKKHNSIFSLRKFTATPNFIAPSPMAQSRPLISPSKLGHGTSWVAGGYWGSEGERQIFSINGSRSSSQSSGFESQTSSANQRNLFSHPPSREESVCGDMDKNATLLDRFQNSNVNNFANIQPPQNFSRISTPVFPQMQYNSHVHIPQPRFAQQQVCQGVFPHQHYVQNNIFKSPGGSGLIKLPQVNSFTSQ